VQDPGSAVSPGGPKSRTELTQQRLFTVALLALAFAIYTRHNDSSFSYHPDEFTKVEQVQNGTRNFHHPLLLLTATNWLKELARQELDCQAIVQLGRSCSAFFAATAVAAFSWLGFYRFGLRGAIVVGILMLLQARPYELAHFMKEDCALLVGIALAFALVDAFWRRPNRLRAILLGAATALAMSGKYVGIVMLVPALAVVVARCNLLPLRLGLSAFAGALLVVFALVNFPAVTSFPAMLNGLNGELQRLNSRSDIEFHFSPFGWVRSFLELSYLLLLFFATHVIVCFRSWRSRSWPDLLLTGFPLAFGLLLSFSSKQSGRYVQPMTVVAALVGVIGALELFRSARAHRIRWAQRLIIIALICSGLYDLGRTALLDRGFQRDHRSELIAWIGQNLPADAIISADDRVRLPADRRAGEPPRFCEVPPLPQKVRVAVFAADLGSLEEMRAAGVSYVAVAEGRYDVFFKKRSSGAPGKEDLFERRREFYRRLFQEGRLVWSRNTGHIGTLNPGLRLYQISPPPGLSP